MSLLAKAKGKADLGPFQSGPSVSGDESSWRNTDGEELGLSLARDTKAHWVGLRGRSTPRSAEPKPLDKLRDFSGVSRIPFVVLW